MSITARNRRAHPSQLAAAKHGPQTIRRGMARSNVIFVCERCGGETLKWQGQCPHCGEWNSLQQLKSPPRSANAAGARTSQTPLALEVAAAGELQRLPSGQEELDRVLG